MRHLQLVCLLAATAALFACTDDELFTIGRTDEPLTPEVMDARTFFENRIAAADQDGTLDLDSYLAPGEVTPVWQKAVVTRTGNEEQVWVPFESDWSYQVRVIVEFKDGSADYRTYPVRQVLLISRDLAGNTCQASYVTLTPTRDYHLKHRSNVLPNFLSKPDHGEYSGMAFYYDAATMEPWKLEEYKKGSITFLTTLSNYETAETFYQVFDAWTFKLQYGRYRFIATKGSVLDERAKKYEDMDWDNNPCPDLYQQFEPYEQWIETKTGEMTHVNRSFAYYCFSGIGQPRGSNAEWANTYEFSVEKAGKEMPVCSPNACVPNCMAYATCLFNNDYSNASALEQRYMNEYSTTGSSITNVGEISLSDGNIEFKYVESTHIESFIRKHFEVNESFVSSGCGTAQYGNQVDYDAELQAKHPIVTNVFENDTKDPKHIIVHSVVVIGKGDDGLYIARDPENNKIFTGNRSMFGSSYEFALSGTKSK